MSQVSSDNFSEDASFRETEGKKYALVVGINKPDKVHSLPALRYAESDATGIGYLLSRKECNFVFPSGLLIGEAASTQNVRKAITYLIDGKSENDLLLFYFIGHGYPAEIDEGKFEVYLVTADFDPREAKLNPDAYLSLSWIREMLYERQKRASIVSILDCNDAKYIVESLPPNKQLAPSLEAFTTNIWKAEQSSVPSHRTWAVLASTYEHIDDSSEGHALMTGLILDALSGDARDALDRKGDLTLQTLHTYLQTQMKRLGSGRQHPIMQGMFHNPLILAYHPSKNPVLRSPEDYSQSSLKPPFDMDISPATFADLDPEQVQMFLKKDRVQIQQDYRADPSEQAQMQALSLLRGKHPSYGALLCFGRDPSHQIVGAYTRCIYWSDTERLSGWEDDREYRGSLLEQFMRACNFLRNHLRFSRVIDRSGSSERPEIPFRALEDAVANALVHREYVTEPDRTIRTEGIQVEIFSDRVEITSPGGPPVPLNTEYPKGHPRNPQVMRIFYLAG
ncbi:MAG TPA: ATP-binding protein, partial [Ktedonobacteraceae bacterium]|nr:ATP-binding protein [Ktedonobacteraceae bacterium]